jgi:hypothetical protein
VAAADKLHNARSIVADLRRIGDAAFSRFSVSREQTLAYRALVTTFRESPAHNLDLVGELDHVVTDMERRPRIHSDCVHRVGMRTPGAASSSHQEKDDR